MNEIKIGPNGADRVARMEAEFLGRIASPQYITDEMIAHAVTVSLRICAEVDKYVSDEHRGMDWEVLLHGNQSQAD